MGTWSSRCLFPVTMGRSGSGVFRTVQRLSLSKDTPITCGLRSFHPTAAASFREAMTTRCGFGGLMGRFLPHGRPAAACGLWKSSGTRVGARALPFRRTTELWPHAAMTARSNSGKVRPALSSGLLLVMARTCSRSRTHRTERCWLRAEATAQCESGTLKRASPSRSLQSIPVTFSQPLFPQTGRCSLRLERTKRFVCGGEVIGVWFAKLRGFRARCFHWRFQGMGLFLLLGARTLRSGSGKSGMGLSLGHGRRIGRR